MSIYHVRENCYGEIHDPIKWHYNYDPSVQLI